MHLLGLGQESMGFTGDQEDVNSMSLTVVHQLLDKHHVDMTDIGWMGVGTETILGNEKVVTMLRLTLYSIITLRESSNYEMPRTVGLQRTHFSRQTKASLPNPS